MDISSVRFFLLQDVRIALQAVGEEKYQSRDEVSHSICKCLRFGQFKNLKEINEIEDDVVSLDSCGRSGLSLRINPS